MKWCLGWARLRMELEFYHFFRLIWEWKSVIWWWRRFWKFFASICGLSVGAERARRIQLYTLKIFDIQVQRWNCNNFWKWQIQKNSEKFIEFSKIHSNWYLHEYNFNDYFLHNFNIKLGCRPVSTWKFIWKF